MVATLRAAALEMATGLAAARIVRRHVGLRSGAQVLFEVARRNARGGPFGPMRTVGAPAASHGRGEADAEASGVVSVDSAERDALSRGQIGPAILIYRQLRPRVGQARALAITGEVVEAGALLFLRHTLGRVDLEFARARTGEQRRVLIERLGRRFPNATFRLDELSAERVLMTVTHCRFPALCVQAGVPELAPLFCRADAVYFGTVLESVELRRPHTIAEGAHTCPFELLWRVAQPLRPSRK